MCVSYQIPIIVGFWGICNACSAQAKPPDEFTSSPYGGPLTKGYTKGISFVGEATGAICLLSSKDFLKCPLVGKLVYVGVFLIYEWSEIDQWVFPYAGLKD